MNSDSNPYLFSREQLTWLKLYHVPRPDGSEESEQVFQKKMQRLYRAGIRMPGTPLDGLAEAAYATPGMDTVLRFLDAAKLPPSKHSPHANN